MNRLGFGLCAIVPIVGFTSTAQAACSASMPTDDQVITCGPNADGTPDATGISDSSHNANRVTVNVSAGANIAPALPFSGAITAAGAKWTINNQGRIRNQRSIGIDISGDQATVNNLSGGTISSDQQAAVFFRGPPDVAVGSGTLNNAANATISGNGGVLASVATMTLMNAGRIESVGKHAAVRLVSGSINNLTGGVIFGSNSTVLIDVFGSGTLINAGSIQNASDSGSAIRMGSGSVENRDGGTIIAGFDGVDLVQGRVTNDAHASISAGNVGIIAGEVINAGSIKSGDLAVRSASVTNLSGGEIAGDNTGVIIDTLGREAAPLTVRNDLGATIRGGTTGVQFVDGGTLTNFGTIESTSRGRAVDFSGSSSDSSVTNYGRIVGDVQMGDGNATLAIATGSTITGQADAGGNSGGILHTKELQLIGSGVDTLNGQAFHGFNSLTVNAPGGSWTLSGSSTFALRTTIDAGLLFVNGSLTSKVVNVLSGGALGGNGSVVGAIWLQPGSIYRVNIDGAQASRLAANAADWGIKGEVVASGATLNAVVGSDGVVVGRSYTVLAASHPGGLVGTFAGLTTNINSAFLSSALSYDAQNVFLRFDRNAVSFASVGQTGNQRAVGAAFDRIGVVSGNPVFNSVLLGSADQARSAYDPISGEGLAGAQNSAFRASSLFTSSVNDQANAWRTGRDGGGDAIVVGGSGALGYAPEGAYASAGPFIKAPATARLDRTWRVWGSAFGGSSTLQGDAGLGTAAQKDSLFGGNIGLDYQVWPNWLVGVAFGGSEGNFAVDSRATSGKVDGVHGGVYGTLTLGQLYLSNATTVSSFSNKTTRVVGNIGGLPGETERGNFSSWQLRSRFEVGHDFAMAGARLTPFAAFEIAQLYSDGFVESSQTTGGAPGVLGLAVSRQTTTSAPLFLGLRGERRIELANGMALTPQASMAWVHEFAPTRNLNGALVSLPGASFIVDGARPASDAAQVSVGAQLDVTRNAALFANFEGEFSNVTQAYAGKGGIRMAW